MCLAEYPLRRVRVDRKFISSGHALKILNAIKKFNLVCIDKYHSSF